MLGILSNSQINGILENNINGRIGFTDGKIVHIVPITYLYDGIYIIAHSKDGLKIKIMRQHPNVCFQVDEILDQTNWKSVLAWGNYEELIEPRERHYALDRLIRLVNNLKMSETAFITHVGSNEGHLVNPEEIKTIVFRIKIENKTGRFEENICS